MRKKRLSLLTRYVYGERSPECVEAHRVYMRNYAKTESCIEYRREYMHHYYLEVLKPKRKQKQ
jgi:hypothetical protein